MLNYLDSKFITSDRMFLQTNISESEFVKQREIEETINLINTISFEDKFMAEIEDELFSIKMKNYIEL